MIFMGFLMVSTIKIDQPPIINIIFVTNAPKYTVVRKSEVCAIRKVLSKKVLIDWFSWQLWSLNINLRHMEMQLDIMNWE